MSNQVDASQALSWSLENAPLALAALAQHLHLAPAGALPESPPPRQGLDSEALGRWLQAAVVPWQLETEAVQPDYGGLTHFLQQAGPTLLLLPDSPRFLLLLGGQRRAVRLLAPDGRIQLVSLETIHAVLCPTLEAPVLPEIERLLATLPTPQQARTRQALLRQRLQGVTAARGWQLLSSPGASFWRQLRQEGVPGRLLAFLLAHAVHYALFLLSWWLAGRAILQGNLGGPWLIWWATLLLLLIPLRLLVTGLQAGVTIRTGRLLQRRLLHGALSLHPDEIRHLGAGQLLGRVFEAETVEALALNGGLLGLTALIELALAAWVLSQGAAGWPNVVGLALWLVVLLGVAYLFYRRRRQWTAVRRHLTHDLIEKMVGQRTYVAQMATGQRHTGEEEMLANYETAAAGMDRAGALLVGLAAQGWLLVGLAGLVPVYLASTVEIPAVAITLGGILSAQAALQKMGRSAVHLANAAIAWEQIHALSQAAARPQPSSAPATAPPALSTAGQPPLLALQNLGFSYPGRRGPVLHDCALHIYPGERLLLEGPSGSGKSTLAAIIAGLRSPQEGSLWVCGREQSSLSLASWRQQVVYTPQFHENYVVGSTFLFNLLLGRRWPPRREEVAAAEALCAELGLGELLQRMPAGMQQTVGEIGWQLSHGERGRLFLARTLLQEAEVMVFDESFASLDPENVRLALQCVMRHARTIIVLAH